MIDQDLSPLQKGYLPQRRSVRSGGFRIASRTRMLRRASIHHIVRLCDSLCARRLSGAFVQRSQI
jgi:hypothetical protein